MYLFCRACHPEYFSTDLTKPREKEGHIAVEFNDAGPHNTKVFLDSEDITSQCVEAMAGQDGFVVVLHETPRALHQLCSCKENAAVIIKKGSVQIFKDDKELT